MRERKDRVARKQRSYEVEFKELAVSRMLRGENVVKLSGELDVRRSVLYRWRDTYRAEGRSGLERRQGRPRPGQEVVQLDSDPSADRIAELERLVGQQAAELDFFERAFNAALLHDSTLGRVEPLSSPWFTTPRRTTWACRVRPSG